MNACDVGTAIEYRPSSRELVNPVPHNISERNWPSTKATRRCLQRRYMHVIVSIEQLGCVTYSFTTLKPYVGGCQMCSHSNQYTPHKNQTEELRELNIQWLITVIQKIKCMTVIKHCSSESWVGPVIQLCSSTKCKQACWCLYSFKIKDNVHRVGIIFHSFNFFSLYDGEKECKGYTLFIHLITMVKKSGGYTFRFPPYWRGKRV